MIIALEGADGAGKSTLSKRIQEDTGIIPIHSGKPKDQKEMKDLVSKLKGYSDSNDLFIIDRVPWISERIYSKVFGRDLNLDYQEIQACENFNHLVIFVNPQKYMVDRSFKPHKNKEFTNLVIKNHDEIVQLYRDIMLEYSQKHKVFYYDWSDPNQYQNVLDLINYYKSVNV
jgi:adenylate kinase family enzyme